MNSKKFTWMKMMSDFYSRLETKGILSMPAGVGYMVIIIFQKMQLLSLANVGNEGIIDYKHIKENLYEEISVQISEKVQDIELTINACSKVGWLEKITDKNNNVIGLYIYELEVGTEADFTFRSRKSRLKQYLKQYPVESIGEKYDIDIFYEIMIKNIDKGRIQSKKQLLDTIEKLLHCNNLPPMLHCNIEKETEKEVEIETDIVNMKHEFEKRGIRFDFNVEKQFKNFDTKLLLKELDNYYLNRNNIRNPLAWLFIACKNHYQFNNNMKTSDTKVKTIRTNADKLKAKQLELLIKEKER